MREPYKELNQPIKKMYHVDPYDQSLVIDGFESGIADSPFNGIADMRNVNITSVPGEASVDFATSVLSEPPTVTTLSFTVDSTTDIFTVASTSSWYNGMAITFNSIVTATGFSTGRVYWIGNLTATTFKLYKNPSGPTYSQQLVDVTASGSGTLSSYTLGKPIQWAIDYSGQTSSGGVHYSRTFMLDDNGLVWWVYNPDNTTPTSLVYIGNDTLTGSMGRGISLFYNYIVVFRASTIDALQATQVENNVDLDAAAPTGWNYGWTSVNSPSIAVQNPRAIIVGQDNVLYFANAGKVGSIMQASGSSFDPTSSITYVKSSTALQLISGEDVASFAELGVNLLVGGIQNKIYPWDRVSTSFSYPIFLAENYVWRMVTVNTNTYIFMGNRGRIYITNGSQAQLYKKVPDHISGTTEPYFVWGDATFNRNQLLFGVSATTNAGVPINQYGGLWAIDLDTSAIRLLNKLSYGTYAGYPTALTQVVSGNTTNASGIGVYIGWDSGASTYGVDQTTSAPYTGSQATIDFDLIPIGTFEKPRNLTRIEYRLTRPLVSGESIVLKTRLIFDTQNTGYTTVLTDSATGSYSTSAPVNFENAQWLQIQGVINSTASSPSFVRLKEIRVTGLKGPVATPASSILG